MTLDQYLKQQYSTAELLEALLQVRSVAAILDRGGDPDFSRIARDLNRIVDCAIEPDGRGRPCTVSS